MQITYFLIAAGHLSNQAIKYVRYCEVIEVENQLEKFNSFE
jgi:hypothetical protein